MWKLEPTPELAEKIAVYIRQGVFDWVAAVASGMRRSKFREWMRSEDPKFAYFQYKIETAMAEARVACETVIAVKEPLAWLMKGPGRERPDAPGWTSSVAVTGKDGGALEQIVEQKPKEDYSRLTVEDMKQMRVLRAKLYGTDDGEPSE